MMSSAWVRLFVVAGGPVLPPGGHTLVLGLLLVLLLQLLECGIIVHGLEDFKVRGIVPAEVARVEGPRRGHG
jgi:hypothetical protein